jgi:hypothetical protein
MGKEIIVEAIVPPSTMNMDAGFIKLLISPFIMIEITTAAMPKAKPATVEITNASHPA